MKFAKYFFLFILSIVVLQAFSGSGGLTLLGHIQKQTKSIDCPVIDISASKIKRPACNKSDGSITGIKVTSTGTKVTYTWHDDNGNEVGHSANLLNIPAGTYVLQVTDNSGCTTISFTPPFIVENANGINIDDSQALVTNSSCNNNGSITGLMVTGATKYEWHNVATGSIVSTSATTSDLVNAAPAEYQLFASNSSCQMTSKAFFIRSTMIVPRIIDTSTFNPVCGASIGSSITVTLLVSAGQPHIKYYFQDSQNARYREGTLPNGNLSPVITASNLDAGTYKFIVEDDNHCSQILESFSVAPGEVVISKEKSIIKNDKCNQHLGAITPFISGVVLDKGTTYRWTDLSTGKVIGQHRSITRVGEGKYEFRINPGLSCFAKDTFTLVNISPSVVPPKAEGSTLCLPGIVNITVTNPDTAATFRLYANLTDSIPIDSNKNGIFYRKIEETTDFYVARVHGDCESDRTQVHEVVVASVKIPNAFTPNSDGVNDRWNIAGIEKFPGADVKIFSRNGQLVFHSINYPAAFDGTYKGSLVPPGVYYYIIDVKEPICFGKISGSLTVIY